MELGHVWWLYFTVLPRWNYLTMPYPGTGLINILVKVADIVVKCGCQHWFRLWLGTKPWPEPPLIQQLKTEKLESKYNIKISDEDNAFEIHAKCRVFRSGLSTLSVLTVVINLICLLHFLCLHHILFHAIIEYIHTWAKVLHICNYEDTTLFRK